MKELLQLGAVGFQAFGLWLLWGSFRKMEQQTNARFARMERWLGALRRAAPMGTCLECGAQAPMTMRTDGHDTDCVFRKL